ncbi:ABC transporter permease [Pseudactinotalea suaedae]|uniref:ABC transporter permease n=1 Tax=Pseudactinotalea suaedae TaxID=1524924 RepID=UPI0012E17137|nr:ABC transporter permease subunit [Pseudactinotalea suaedae]
MTSPSTTSPPEQEQLPGPDAPAAWSAGTRPPARSRKRTSTITRPSSVLYLFALPGLLLLVLFHYVPLLGNIIAFKSYLPFIGILESPWVGWENFTDALADQDFYRALTNTLIITFVQVVLVFPAPLVLALMLNSMMSQRLRQTVQAIVYMPHFLSWVIVVAVFQEVFGAAGVINHILRATGGRPLEIMTNPDLFISLVTAQVIWKDAGWAAILFFAALAQIDRNLYEAASVDGASRMRQLWHITMPGLKGIVIMLLILKLGNALSVGFEQIILQQNAVGRDASEVLDTYVYNNGLIGGDWGMAAAVGLMKSIISVAIVLGANKVAHIFGEDGVYRRVSH